jgi:periplasmic protein TonB
MATLGRPKDPIEEIQLVAAGAPDRLPAMLFLAALIHGILIIGVTFNPYLMDGLADAISLEVTIVADPDQRIDRPDKAQYLAQASQLGGGNTTADVRPSAPLESASPIDNLGVEDGQSLRESTVHERSSDQVLTTRNDRDLNVTDHLRAKPQTDRSTAIALEVGSDQTLPLPQENDGSMLIHDDNPQQKFVSADTRESLIAAYLDKWKRRIEAVGDEYFAEFGNLDGLTGSPTLEVRIEASGQLSEVIIRKSSGSRVVDQAALDILRRASPFEAFPDEVAADYDRFLFTYKWLFSERLIPAAASLN